MRKLFQEMTAIMGGPMGLVAVALVLAGAAVLVLYTWASEGLDRIRGRVL